MQEIDLCKATGWMQRMSLMFFFSFFFYCLAEPGGMWDLISSSPGMEPLSPALGP